MQTLGLDAEELRAYGRGLAQGHTLDIDMRVLDLSGNLIRSLEPAVNSGQVDYNSDEAITRVCRMEFLDPTQSWQFRSDDPSGSVYFDNMIRLWYRIRVPDLDYREVGCAVFTGPVNKFTRQGQVVSIEAQSLESRGLHGVSTLTIRKGTNAIDAIERIMRERCGETRFAFPTTRRRLPANVVVSWEDGTWPWQKAKAIARSLGLQLFYDGAGVLRLRVVPTSAQFVFKSGEGGNIRTQPSEDHDKSQIKNRWVVIGNKPANTATETLDDSHPFSSWALRRNGVREYLTEEISDSRIGSVSAARARARSARARFERMEFGAGITTYPVPHLDNLDMVRIRTEYHDAVERPRQWSFPLTGGDMTVGYNDVVSVPKVRTR